MASFRARIFVMIAGLLGLALQCAGQAATTTDAVGEITVKSTKVTELTASGVRFAVDLSIVPSRNVTVEKVRLGALSFNGIPVFADPISQTLVWTKGNEFDLPTINLTIHFANLMSVDPIREMLEKELLHVQGQIVVGIKATWTERLALHTEHPQVSIPLRQDVHVAFAQSSMERKAELGLLNLLEMGLKSGLVAGSSAALDPQWKRDKVKLAANALVLARTSYRLKPRSGEGDDSEIALEQLGFWLAAGPIVTTAEIRTPWEYEPELLARIHAGMLKIVPKATDISIQSPQVGAHLNLKLSNKDFTIDEQGKPATEQLVVEDVHNANVKVRRRTSPGSYSVLAGAPHVAEGFAAAPETVLKAGRWEKLLVFRLVPAGTPWFEALELAAHSEGDWIVFDGPVDPSAFGSPIIAPEGVLGIVQDEGSGSLIHANLLKP